MKNKTDILSTRCHLTNTDKVIEVNETLNIFIVSKDDLLPDEKAACHILVEYSLCIYSLLDRAVSSLYVGVWSFLPKASRGHKSIWKAFQILHCHLQRRSCSN